MINMVIVPAFISLLLSLGLMFSGIPNAEFYSLYVGLWVPSILAYGILLCVSDKDRK
jgi:ABC-type multidrug transport system permease subunit